MGSRLDRKILNLVKLDFLQYALNVDYKAVYVYLLVFFLIKLNILNKFISTQRHNRTLFIAHPRLFALYWKKQLTQYWL